MQISTSADADDDDDDDDPPTISMTLLPSLTVPPGIPEPARSPAPAELTPDTPARGAPETPIQSLFAAISACANLHPDPVSADDDGEMMGGPPIMFEGGVGYQSSNSGGAGLPPPVPGSGGWITAENVGEFFDEEGNWRGGGLGAGAGSVREREREEEEEGEEDGEGVFEDAVGEGEETKWRRTE